MIKLISPKINDNPTSTPDAKARFPAGGHIELILFSFWLLHMMGLE